MGNTANKTDCGTAAAEKTGCGEANAAAWEMDCSKGDLMGHGAPSWIELSTSDAAAAKAFYGGLFGWTTSLHNDVGMPYHMVHVDGQPRGGIFTLPPECQSTPPHWGVVIAVNDIDVTAKQAEALGGKVIVAPFDIPTIGRYATFQDPQGAIISAITYLKK